MTSTRAGKVQMPANSTIKAMLFGLGALMVAGSAGAATTWGLYSGAPGCSGSGASRTCPSGATPNVTATAWAFNGTGAGASAQSRTLGVHDGGVGVYGNGDSSSSPNHAADNYQYMDMVLLSFWDEVTLTAVTTGWVGALSGASGDSDFSVLAYQHSTAPTVSGNSAAGLTASGWDLVSHYNGTGNSGGETKTVNDGPTTYTSKYWIVAAYNPNFGGAANGADWGSGQYDFLKLYSVSFNTPTRVPEPGTALLLGAALLGGYWTTRRRRSTRA